VQPEVGGFQLMHDAYKKYTKVSADFFAVRFTVFLSQMPIL
jgi:hypothetical protein